MDIDRANEIMDDLKEKIELGLQDLKKKIKESNLKIKNSWNKSMDNLKVTFAKVKSSKIFKFNPFDPSSWEDSDNFEPENPPSATLTIETFEELRNHNTEELALKQLNELAIDLKSLDASQLTEAPRNCFILCNTYNKPQYKLGVGPLNDSITVAANHKRMGYTVYFLHNPTSDVFLKYLPIFLQKTTQHLTVFYTGHGANVKDLNNDEKDGLDEVIVFDENYITDDELAKIVRQNASGKAKVILLNDCCHSGTIWDLPTDIEKAKQFPANIICLSAANDDEQAKQGRRGFNDQGFFTFLLFKEVRTNKAVNPRDIQSKITNLLVSYNQRVVVTPTRPELLDQPLFPQD
ncbi:hypothetical protein M9Y10_039718 [Tritrichomonas musculus]|uniref:Peptidase C14 caspase domain-containing protein n=1 Tax=Tritrichomonas musculus TaxID=1915356 RepID=A0ABR2GT17_9EUKA